MAKHLREKGINIQGTSISGNFVKSSKDEVDEGTNILAKRLQPNRQTRRVAYFISGQYLRYAFGIVSSYLSKDLAEKLRENLKIPADKKPTTKREPTESLVGSANKKAKTAASAPTEDYSKGYKSVAAKETPKNAKQKALAKSASGSKSITSFFTKK